VSNKTRTDAERLESARQIIDLGKSLGLTTESARAYVECIAFVEALVGLDTVAQLDMFDPMDAISRRAAGLKALA